MPPTNTPVAPQAPEQPKPFNQSLIISLGIIVAGGLVAGAIIWNGGHGTVSAGAGQAQQQPTVQAADVSKVNTVGEPFIGNANAPATMAYWTDYQCPFCKQNEEDVMPEIIQNYVDTGKLKIIFKDFPFLGPDSITLGEYGRAVWAEDPAKFYDWHKAIFDNQGEEGSGWATQAKIDSITSGVLGAAETSKVNALVVANKATYDTEINADKAEGTAMGVSGTPSFIIGKQLIVGAQPYAQISASIDTALK